MSRTLPATVRRVTATIASLGLLASMVLLRAGGASAEIDPTLSPPTNVIVTAGVASATVTWTLSTDPDYHYYAIVATDETNPANSTGDEVDVDVSTDTFHNLTDGDVYVFSVSTDYTSEGRTSTPAISNEVTIETGVAPPWNVGAIPGIDEAEVSWIASADTDVTGYIATAVDATTPANGGQSVTVSGDETSAVVTGLTGGDDYTFTVTTVEGSDTSTPAPSYNDVVALVVASPPTNVDIQTPPHNTFISFDNPFEYGITGFETYVVDDSNAAHNSALVTVNASTTSYHGFSFVLGDTYTAYVAIVEGSSVSSFAASDPVTIPNPPAAPTNVVAVAATDSAVISWTAAATATHYSVSAIDETDSNFGGQGGGGSDTTATITGLRPGDTYVFTVLSFSADNTRSTSVTGSNTVVPTPAPPTDVQAVAGSNSVALSWTASIDSNVTSYSVTAIDSTTPAHGGQVVAATETSTNVTGLTAGDSYTFTVAAAVNTTAGVASDPSNAVVPTLPIVAPPAAVSATAGVTSASVSWTASTDGGVTGYTVTPIDATNPANSGAPITTLASATTAAFIALTPGDDYSFTVVTLEGGRTSAAVASPSVVPTAVAESDTTSSTSTSPTGTTQPITVSSTGSTSAAASGTGIGTLTIGSYSAPPVAADLGSASYFDIAATAGSAFTSITVQFCPVSAGTVLQWWNPTDGGGAWDAVTNVVGPTGSPACDIATITATSSPSLAQLYGTVFALDAPAPTITTTALPTGTQGVVYSTQLAGSGGIGSLTYSATGLPDGLTLSTTGRLSGTPTGSGTTTVGVTVTDGNGVIGSTTLGLVINPPVVVPPTTKPVLTVPALAGAVVGYRVSIGILVSGVTNPVISTSKLPAGLTLTQAGNKATIAGTPTASGTTAITVTVKGASNVSVSKTLTLVVFAPPTFTTATTFSGSKGAENFTVSASGAPTPILVVTSRIPSWLHVTRSAGSLKFTGTEPKGTKAFKFTVVAINAFGARVQTITVNPQAST